MKLSVGGGPPSATSRPSRRAGAKLPRPGRAQTTEEEEEEAVATASRRWAEFRFAVVGHLLVCDVERGQLGAELKSLSAKNWKHPISGRRVIFGYSTIERWYYIVLKNPEAPLRALSTRRRDAGLPRNLTKQVRHYLARQAKLHSSWSYSRHQQALVRCMNERRWGLGPLAVKKHGGRSFVKKGEALVVPQLQTPKGSIILAGALSAKTNQMTWCYVQSKDTTAMIDLIELLFSEHRDKTRLYITWDAASWHDSISLVDWLDAFNLKTTETKEGPLITLVPLPSCSQFLNVIESVFGVMKKAVIHHSDYQSAHQMKSAISQHFRERNEHFKDNPRRAGKKIWEIDFFRDPRSLPSGNYREY